MSKSVVATALITSLFLGLWGCGGTITKKPPINLESKGKLALVSYSLNNSIVEKGKKSDSGPGLLQKKEKYFEDHIEALEGILDDFLNNMNDVFGNAPVIDIASVTDNETYQNLTKHIPKKVMGKDVAPGADKLIVKGVNYVSKADTEKLDKLAQELGVDLLVLVENQAEYSMSGGVGLKMGSLSLRGGAATLTLKTNLSLYEPGQGIILNESFSNDSEEKIPMVQGHVNTKHYPKCLLSAGKKNIDAMKNFFVEQKNLSQQPQQP